MSKTYFAAGNSFASETDVGFDNTWYVLAFDSRKARDDYVSIARDLATRAIRRDQVTAYAENLCLNTNKTNSPKPFSGEYWGIVECYDWKLSEIDGIIGQVEKCDGSSYCVVRRLNKKG